MQAMKWGMAVLSLVFAAACNAPVNGAQTAQGPREITLANGRSVIFHDGVQFGGFIEKNQNPVNLFKTQAVNTVSSVSGTASATGFIALVTLSATPGGNQDIWLFRKGSASAGAMADLGKNGVTTSGHKVASYASTFRSGGSIALQVPADIIPGTYGVGVEDNAGAAGTFTASQVKSAFTLTDDTAWAKAVYDGTGTAVAAKANI